MENNKTEKEKEIQELTLIPDEEIHAIIFTGKKVVVTMSTFMPFIDCHMHIESNNCCPMTLQWGLIRSATKNILSLQGANRRELNIFSATFMQFGKIGRLSTDFIAKVFMNDIYNMKIKDDMYWTFLSKKVLKKFDEFRRKADELFKKEGLDDEEKERLEKTESQMKQTALGRLVKQRDKKYQDFHEYAAYYFGKKQIFHMFIAMPMDLSYAHYWGKFGLPIYLPYQDKVDGKTKYFFINDFLSLDLYNPEIHKKGLYKTYEERPPTMLDVDYDISLKENEKCFEFSDPGLSYNTEKGLKKYDKKYKHFLDEVPKETSKTFEDYQRQRKNTVAASIMYPFQIIPFYHYDPRRHNKDRIKELVKEIKNNHAFFEYEEKKYKIELKPRDDIDFDSIFNDSKKTNEMVFKNIIPNTNEASFWGFKMYTELGYAPYDTDTYPELDKFYDDCSKQGEEIPITCHCMPIGMTIADSHIYFKEALKRTNDSKYSKQESNDIIEGEGQIKLRWDYSKYRWKTINRSLRYVDELCVNPKNWIPILNKYNNLKICFAHFGGDKTWTESKAETKIKWEDYFDWKETIFKILEDNKFSNVYTDLAFFINRWWDIKEIAERLADRINNSKNKDKMKNHILMGSDWYMIETKAGEKGIGRYYNRMFRMLKLVSEKVEFDAWYQFAIENPLRFLGLIDDNGDTISDKGKDKLRKHREFIKEKVKDTYFLKEAGIDDDQKDIILEKADKFVGTEEKKKYQSSKEPKKYKGYMNILNLEPLRDMKGKSGKLLITEEAKTEEE